MKYPILPFRLPFPFAVHTDTLRANMQHALHAEKKPKFIPVLLDTTGLSTIGT